MSVVYPRRLIFVYIQGQDDVHSKSDLCSCEATLAVAKKAQKKKLKPQIFFWAFFVNA